jgi:hypothetical protein
MTEIDQLEIETIGIARRIREEFTVALSKLHLDSDSPELSRNATPGNAVSSEVTMYIRRDGDIVDVIEFHVHRGGVAVAAPQEIESWLRTTFEDVLRRQRDRQ